MDHTRYHTISFSDAAPQRPALIWLSWVRVGSADPICTRIGNWQI
jgi:hypothetical protein